MGAALLIGAAAATAAARLGATYVVFEVCEQVGIRFVVRRKRASKPEDGFMCVLRLWKRQTGGGFV